MFIDVFEKLCAKACKSPSAVLQELSMSTALYPQWKNGQSPRSTTKRKLAEYFGVSPDYFNDIDYNALAHDIGHIETRNDYDRVIPVFESVSAGLGINASDYIIGYESISIRSDKEASETIGIKVKGFSMYPEIKDGDIIIVHKQPECENKKIAVVRVDDSYYVKQFIKEDDKIILHSINPEYQDREFVGDDMNKVIIIGIVTRQIRLH